MQKGHDGNVFAKIVLFSGDVIRYSVVGVVGVIVVVRKFRMLSVGFYFWVKFLQSFLNVFASLLMLSLISLKFTDMIMTVAFFAID